MVGPGRAKCSLSLSKVERFVLVDNQRFILVDNQRFLLEDVPSQEFKGFRVSIHSKVD